MTVGISYTNKQDLVVITDVQGSMGGRQFNNVSKLKQFETKDYHGVVYGTGSANVLLNIHENIERYTKGNLEDMMDNISGAIFNEEMRISDEYFKKKKREIKSKAFICPDNTEDKNMTEGLIEHETMELLNAIKQEERDNKIRGIGPSDSLRIDVYDNKHEKNRSFSLTNNGWSELYLNVLEVGSGSDAANLYGNMKTQGLLLTELSLSGLLFHATQAYSASTVNRGVGGTPKIAIINKDGIQMVDKNKTAMMTNISGAKLADLIDKKTAIDSFDCILNNWNSWIDGECENTVKEIESLLGISSKVLSSATIPYSTWQEIANNDR